MRKSRARTGADLRRTRAAESRRDLEALRIDRSGLHPPPLRDWIRRQPPCHYWPARYWHRGPVHCRAVGDRRAIRADGDAVHRTARDPRLSRSRRARARHPNRRKRAGEARSGRGVVRGWKRKKYDSDPDPDARGRRRDAHQSLSISSFRDRSPTSSHSWPGPWRARRAECQPACVRRIGRKSHSTAVEARGSDGFRVAWLRRRKRAPG